MNYNREKQIQQLHNRIIALSKQFDDNIRLGRNEDDCIEHYQEELSDYLLQRCMSYKRPAFEHENEYRFVIAAPICTFDEDDNKSVVAYHVGGSGLIIPHLEVDFKPQKVVESIMIAPMMEREVAKHGIQRLLDSKEDNSKSKIAINFSQIDIRYQENPASVIT